MSPLVEKGAFPTHRVSMAPKGGVGIQLRDPEDARGAVRVVGLKPGGPAFESGHMLIGDELCSVDGHDVRGYRVEQVARLLGGAAGTSVQVSVLCPSTRQRTAVSLVRQSLGQVAERTRPGSSDTAASSASGDAFRPGSERRSPPGGALSEGDSAAMVSPQSQKSTWEEVQGTLQDCLARVRADGGAQGLATARTLLALAGPPPQAGVRAFQSSGTGDGGRAGRVLEVLRFVGAWARQVPSPCALRLNPEKDSRNHKTWTPTHKPLTAPAGGFRV